jgi:hypothetical protein
MKKIPFLLTILIHVIGIFSFSFSCHAVKPPQEAKMRIVTKEIRTHHPSHIPVVAKETPTPSVIPLIQKPLPPPTPKKKLMPTAKKVVPKKKEIASTQVKKKLEKALSKIEPTTKPKTLPKKPAPVKEPSPSIETPTVDNYLNSICTILEELLTLPEKGIVKLTITVQANGKIGMVKEVSFESERNLRYLKEMLETLSFPKPAMEKEVEFTITFCGDE